jgi:hypothetical protein
VPRRGVVLLLAVVAAGATAAALVLPDEEERQGRPPPAATESPRPAETESAPPTDVPEPEAPAPGRRDGPRLVIGFVDDPSFRWRPYRKQMLDRARAAGARLVRAMVYWHRMAPRRPAAGEPPFDEPRLFELDELLANTAERGMEVMLTIWGTPDWANGGEKPNRPPHDLDALGEFARGLAARYPQVRRYSVWNEPNLEQFLAPQFDATGQSVAAQLYARLFRAATSASGFASLMPAAAATYRAPVRLRTATLRPASRGCFPRRGRHWPSTPGRTIRFRPAPTSRPTSARAFRRSRCFRSDGSVGHSTTGSAVGGFLSGSPSTRTRRSPRSSWASRASSKRPTPSSRSPSSLLSPV